MILFQATSTTVVETTTTLVETTTTVPPINDFMSNEFAASAVISLLIGLLIAGAFFVHSQGAIASASLMAAVREEGVFRIFVTWWRFGWRFAVGILLLGIPAVVISGYLLAQDSDRVGTLADWAGVAGTGLAAIFGYLAWQASRRATQAEEKAAALSEAQLNQSVRFHVTRHSAEPGLTVLRFQLLDGSPTVWIRTAEGGFRPRYNTPESELAVLNEHLQQLVGWDMTQGESLDVGWNHADQGYEFSDWGDHRPAGLVFDIGFSLADPRTHPTATVFHRELTWAQPFIA